MTRPEVFPHYCMDYFKRYITQFLFKLFSLFFLCAQGESTLTDAMTAAGKTYEEIAQLVAEQVGHMPNHTLCDITDGMHSILDIN